MRDETADDVRDDRLISPPLRDSLLVKLSDLREREAIAKEKEKAERAIINKAEVLRIEKQTYFWSFGKLCKRYFGISRENVDRLTVEEKKELKELVYKLAKQQLLWKAPLWFAATYGFVPLFLTSISLAGSFPGISFTLLIPTIFSFGHFMIFGTEVFGKTGESFPVWRFVLLHKRYRETEPGSEDKN